MKDYRELFGYAAILFGIGFVFRSVDVAYASPTGPNTSLGQNPIVVFSGGGNTGGNKLLDTIPSNKVLILTDFSFQNTTSSGGSVYIRDGSGTDLAYFGMGNSESKHISKNTGIPFGPNSELNIDIYGGNIQYTITGYYTHP